MACESVKKEKYNIAQNQSFVQIEVGSKIEPYKYSPIFINLAIPLIEPISAYYFNNKLYYFLIKSP